MIITTTPLLVLLCLLCGGRTIAADAALRLESDCIPAGIRLQSKTSDPAVHSIRMEGSVPADGNGKATIWIDPRPAELNGFGDIRQRPGPRPDAIPVELRYRATSAGEATNQFLPDGPSPASAGFRLYDVVFPGRAFNNTFKLVLGTTNLGPHRLLVYSGAGSAEQRPPPSPAHILPLAGEPAIISSLEDTPLPRTVHLRAQSTTLNRQPTRLWVHGAPGGAGTLAFDPNAITFDRFGEAMGTTLMGYRQLAITLIAAAIADPLAKGRTLYWAAPAEAQNTNRVALVLGPTEAGPHRLLVYNGNQAELILRAELVERRNQELVAGQYAVLSNQEQRSIVDFRRAIGNGFRFEIEDGQATALAFTSTPGRVPPVGMLAQFPHLRSIDFNAAQGPFVGLADLRQLPHLRTLRFASTELNPDALALLRDLRGLETLSFYQCPGINDAGVKSLAGLTQLKTLSFYSEELLHRPPAPQRPCVTDAGLVHLGGLIHLEYLDLFGHDLSDASAGILIRMTSLGELALSGRGFTDAGLSRLAGLPNLRRLRLFETGVTTNGIAALKKRLPQLQVESGRRGG